MAKRFTSTDKYKDPFIRGLQGAYKVLWDYLHHECDHAGIWIVDFEVAQIRIGADLPINKDGAIAAFNTDQKARVIEFDGGRRWFIPDFLKEQYTDLNPENRVHASVISSLSEWNLLKENKPLTSPLQGAKDKDKDKEEDKLKEKDAREILDYLNQKSGKSFRPVKANLSLISGRLSDGYSKEQIKTVIDTKAAKWKNDAKMVDYLRPDTLFRPSNFESYLNEIPAQISTNGFPNGWDHALWNKLTAEDMAERAKYIKHMQGLGMKAAVDEKGNMTHWYKP